MNNNVKLHWQSAILRGKWCREREREGVMETRDIEVSSHVMRAEVKVLVAPFIGCAIFIPEYLIHASNYFEHTAYVSAKNFCIVVLHNCWFFGFLVSGAIDVYCKSKHKKCRKPNFDFMYWWWQYEKPPVPVFGPEN